MKENYVTCSKVELNILGVAVRPKKRVKKYPIPKVIIDFRATVDVDLVVNGIYIQPDCDTQFRAVSKNVIVNFQSHVLDFTIPTCLILISQAYAE